MIKRTLIILAFILFCLLPVSAQVKKQDTGPKREITLYNPYKPSLPESRKMNFLPDMNDTLKVTRDFRYDVWAEPFMPDYTIIPVKAAALLPDPLPKLYKSFVKIGFGNYTTPLAEVSITNERSKKGSIGFYGRHYSTNGKIELRNGEKVFAGYMDNDASIFGRKFFRKNIFESSVDYSGKTRYAYGYDTSIVGYSAVNKDIRLTYNNIGAKVSLSSINLDSTEFSYNFGIFYNFFHNTKNLFQHSAGIDGIMAKSFNELYIGSGINYEFVRLPDLLLTNPKYIASISPFVKKSTGQWNFKLGFEALLDRNMDSSPEFHIYPDLRLGFSVIPSYVSFFAGLSGKLEKNDPLKIITENPFLVRDGSLFAQPNTNHKLIVSAGLKGNTGIGGNYLISTSYSLINDMLFYSNLVSPVIMFPPEVGNYFFPLPDDVELLNIHGEVSGVINDKITFNGSTNWNKYTLSESEYAWNKPAWDVRFGVKYNLKDKIIIGAELTGIGKRKLHAVDFDIMSSSSPTTSVIFDEPIHFNLNLTAEYRYTKILSIWAKFDNITYNRYYEWAYYPSQRFLCMLGFTYSL